ncbi:putative Myeloid leukemia factor 1 [Hypsibius exemplaris]|uniref:Myeloid leukemia factor 1 n=1 Tax=Hypsibius exemplaris TaxID=2072580 RepID=A0A1W0W9X1_HYPEX|nr:putative Myeloid leukemia factor 1 [Hypsibius exemplaris]
MSGNSYGLLRSSFFPSSQTTAAHILPEQRAVSKADCSATSNSADEDSMTALLQMDSVFDEIESIMRQSNQKVLTESHSFSATSVQTYFDDGQGSPKLYQASVATRIAPGGVRETRKSSRDTVSGMEKMSLDRYLGDRAHLEERSHNCMTGQREEQTEFINMDEEDADEFEEEWRRKIELPLAAAATKPTHQEPSHEEPSQVGQGDKTPTDLKQLESGDVPIELIAIPAVEVADKESPSPSQIKP